MISGNQMHIQIPGASKFSPCGFLDISVHKLVWKCGGLAGVPKGT